MTRNKKGQITSSDPISVEIPKELLKIANDLDIKIKAIIRDELKETLADQIRSSYTPATKAGKDINQYNKTHKHQKANSYHHTGTLARNVYAVIRGDGVRAMIRDEKYENGTSTTEVYNYLKFGTTDNPASDTYGYDNGTKFAKYVALDPHNFEARTRAHMRNYLLGLQANIEQNGIKYINARYIKK